MRLRHDRFAGFGAVSLDTIDERITHIAHITDILRRRKLVFAQYRLLKHGCADYTLRIQQYL
jgi:hypothetical protein